MSDGCEKTCPLCAGEMDLTDQQLKPCNCGYEICVWCWHHIMDMAEKDEIEGRCPACRTPYDKERIVGMAGKCERLVAEFSMEKKQKSQRPKTRTSEGRKQLSSVRVIQRNLVYVVGLPLNLADEDLLQRKEYFSRYGKVLKVSLSRTSSGSIQQFPNNTCSVYITYSKEEEAVCCIQLVHGFTLEGRLLRACFGTTKYCHAWLRNVPCSNPDCLYLHEIGSQEDSFTKDEIVSAYTRVQQITGVANNAQRGSGNILPPPADEYCCNNSTSSAKFSVKIASNNSACTARVSFPSSAGALSALPPAASWGARALSCQLPAGGMACSNGLSKQKADEVRGSLPLSKTVARTNPASLLPCNTSNELLSDKEALARHPKNKSESLQTVKLHRGIDPDNNEPAVVASNNEQSCSLVSEKSKSGAAGMIQEPRSDLPSMSIGEESNCEHSRRIRPSDSHLDNILSPISQGSRRHDIEKLQDEHSTMAAVSKAAASMDTVNASSGKSDSRSDVQTSTVQILASEAEDDFDKQRIRDAIVASPSPFTSSPHSLNMLNHLKGPLLERNESDSTFNFDVDPPLVNIKPAEPTNVNLISGSCGLGGARFLVNGAHRNQMGMLNGETVSTDTQEGLDMGESNIISNILSLDLDSWDDSLTSPQNLVKLLDETDKQCGSVKLSSSHRSQMSNQSRFSFVRHDECSNSVFEIEPSYGDTGQMPNNDSFVENRDPFLNQLGNGFEFTHRNVELFDNISSSQPIFSSSKPSVSRAQISAPPGFSLPNRPPPPGFSSRERSYQTFDIKSGNHLLEPSSFLRDARQASLSENFTVGDIEFIDPAILAVGKGRLPDSVNNPGMDMRPGISSQTSAFGNESKLQLLMQRSISPHQNLTYTHVRDSYSPPNDAYGFTLRHLEQTKTSNLSPLSEFAVQQSRNAMMSNGH